ncbi:hypothetical protein AB0M20_22670 [Actinoplanes sp. NPDC051633]|uniref:hypothetical protein n=1 Tax=Actinoplanes sp. NPDC051633 TaxID=3155670 RepID=UPI00343522C6
MDADRIGRVRLPANASPGRLYASRTSAVATRDPAGAPYGDGAGRLRELARAGKLAQVAAGAGGTERMWLTGAAYEVAWPIVFARLTRRLEYARGHAACAVSIERLAPDCLDRFHEDVEAVVHDVLTHARRQILDLEAWVASRLQAATVDGHRRMRGRRGALQRPRLPMWIADGLHRDPWLTTLATEILVWVGIGATAGEDVWPLESWAYQRGAKTGDWVTSEPAVVASEVEAVLAVMRTRPAWYASYVEQPLGTKQTPVATLPVGDAAGETATPLAATGPYEEIDTELLRLAADAVCAIDARISRGEQAEQTVVDVIRAVFGGTFRPALDRAPHAVADPVGGLTGALTDPTTLDRIVTTVLSIIGRDRP